MVGGEPENGAEEIPQEWDEDFRSWRRRVVKALYRPGFYDYLPGPAVIPIEEYVAWALAAAASGVIGNRVDALVRRSVTLRRLGSQVRPQAQDLLDNVTRRAVLRECEKKNYVSPKPETLIIGRWSAAARRGRPYRSANVKSKADSFFLVVVSIPENDILPEDVIVQVIRARKVAH